MARNKAVCLTLLFLVLASFCWAQDDDGSIKNLQGAAWFVGDDEAESVMLLGRLDDKNYIATLYIRTLTRYTEDEVRAIDDMFDGLALLNEYLRKDGYIYVPSARYVADAQVTIKGNKAVFNGRRGKRITNLYPESPDCLAFDLTISDGKVSGDTISVTVEGMVEFSRWNDARGEYENGHKKFEKRRINFKRFYP